MSADIKQLRIRIKSVDSTLHLTKAMGLVASSKIRRASESMNYAKQYEKALSDLIKRLGACDDCKKSVFSLKRSGARTKLIVIAGDRGLAGGYNANIFRLMREYTDSDVIAIGKRSCDRFHKEIRYAESFSYTDAQNLANSVCSDFANGEYDRLGIVYTKYISMMSQEAEIKWILPLERNADVPQKDITFEPSAPAVLEKAVPEYVAGVIYSAVKESFASEVAARRVAMDSAGKNAQEMIDELGLKYNRARQGAITQEITEIVAGSGN